MNAKKLQELEKKLKQIIDYFGYSGAETTPEYEIAIKEVLRESFPQEPISFSIIRVMSNGPIMLEIGDGYGDTLYVIPSKLSPGELTLYSNLISLKITKNTSLVLYNFWESFLKDLSAKITAKDVLFLAKWIESLDLSKFEIVKKEMGITECAISYWKRDFMLAKRKGFIPENMDQKTLLSHIFVTGRLPYLREAKKFINFVKNSHEQVR